MKVLLKEDVDNLGYAGEVTTVADGYGRNYLIPRGLAVKATPGVLNSAKAWREKAALRTAELKKEHKALSERIQQTTLNFTARAGETGKLYGSITTADIVEQLNERLGTDIERRSIVSDPLRQLGEHHITVRLSRDFQPMVRVFVSPYEETEEEAKAAAETETIADELSDVADEHEEELVEETGKEYVDELVDEDLA